MYDRVSRKDAEAEGFPALAARFPPRRRIEKGYEERLSRALLKKRRNAARIRIRVRKTMWECVSAAISSWAKRHPRFDPVLYICAKLL
jgi:rubrerythrin